MFERGKTESKSLNPLVVYGSSHVFVVLYIKAKNKKYCIDSVHRLFEERVFGIDVVHKDDDDHAFTNTTLSF
jgi:hypothetical protein